MLRDQPALKVTLAILVHKAHKVIQAPLDLREILVLRVLKVRILLYLVHKVLPEKMELQALKVSQVRMAPLVLMALHLTLERMVTGSLVTLTRGLPQLVLKVLMELMVLMVKMEHLAQMVRVHIRLLLIMGSRVLNRNGYNL